MIRRKQTLIDRSFQLRTTFRIIGITIIAFLLVAALMIIYATDNNARINRDIADIQQTLAGPRTGTVDTNLVQQRITALRAHNRNNSLLIAAIAGVILAHSFFLYFYLIKITHRISGPIFLMNRYMKQIMNGEHPRFRNLRKNDEFQEFYKTFVEMAEKMQG